MSWDGCKHDIPLLLLVGWYLVHQPCMCILEQRGIDQASAQAASQYLFLICADIGLSTKASVCLHNATAQ